MERDAKAQAGVKIKMALTYEANGECYEAVELCLRCLEQCKAADDQVLCVGGGMHACMHAC